MARPSLKNFRRIVVKVGSSLLIDSAAGEVRASWLSALAADIAKLHGEGRDVLVVSSGSIALGRSRLKLPRGPLKLEESQGAAAVGQIALARIWSALKCPNAGDILLSASPGYEFVDWGGADHVGGGSHGSLHRTDSLGALLWCGTGPASASIRGRWSLRDVAPMCREHFGISDGASGLAGQRDSGLEAD